MEQVLLQTLTQISIALISLAGAYALYFLSKAKVKLNQATEQNIKDEAQRKLVQDALDRVELLATNIVGHTQQVSVDAIKQAIADGKLDKSELQALGKQAAESVYAQLNEDTKSLLEQELGDINLYISNVVETQVLKLKNSLK